jgi:glycine/serine hydroxymethyltransferase
MGTIEVTRLGMGEGEMAAIAELIVRLLGHKEDANAVLRDVAGLRGGFQTLYYCFDTRLPP